MIARNRGGWTASARERLDVVRGVLHGLRPYWPLTLRQVYYQLVAREVIANRRAEYQALSRLLVKARLDGEVPWEALEDRVREHLGSAGWADADDFIAEQGERLLVGYRRDLLAGQDLALEVWIEKDALSRICHDVAFGYCVPVVVARGFSSVSFLHECRRRVERAVLDEGKKGLRILYFGDLDPSGWAMLPAMLRTLQEEMRLGELLVDGERIALTPEQVEKHRLPHSVEAMKATDTRTPAYRDWLRSDGHPDTLAVELDALSPEVLQGLVRDAIETSLDMERVERERAAEAGDVEAIRVLKAKVDRALKRGPR